jgi:hypothetical protein
MVAYEKALDWQELFDLVLREGITGDKLTNIARRMAGVSVDFCNLFALTYVTRGTWFQAAAY